MVWYLLMFMYIHIYTNVSNNKITQMLIETISKYIYLNNDDKEQIAICFEKSVGKKNEILFREGSHVRKLFFIESGFVRSFYIKDNGSEKTHWVYSENDFFTSWYSFFTGKPSFESLQIINEAVLYSISESNYIKLCDTSNAFNGFINGYYQHLIAEMDFLSKSFLQLSAKEKYQYLLETSPKMVQEIKLGTLASLLDISQETLSRIRRQH